MLLSREGSTIEPSEQLARRQQLQRQGSINLQSFQELLKSHRVSTGSTSVKDAYQHFKRVEAQRQRNGMDASPQIVLGIMKDQLDLAERRKMSNGGGGMKKPLPPPPTVSREGSSGLLVFQANQNNNNHEEKVTSTMSARRGSLPGHEEILLPKAHELARRQLAPMQRIASEPRLGVVRQHQPPPMQKRNTIGSPISNKKPPPPNKPPPSLQQHQQIQRRDSFVPLSKHKPPPPLRQTQFEESAEDTSGLLELEDDMIEAKPNTSRMMSGLNQKQHVVSAANNGTGGSSRETFILRDKLASLEAELEKEREEKQRIKDNLLQVQRDLHLTETNLKETEANLASLREEKSKDAEFKDQLRTLQLEQKTAARKSRQRFDAAIDFMKGMLVDAKFENLVQVIKSRLRIVVGAERTEVYIVDHKNGELVSYRERTGSRKPLPSGSRLWMGRFPMDSGIVGAVIEEKSMQVVKDVENDVRFDALVDGIGSNGVRNLVVYPILMRKKVVAVVVVANKLAANGRVTGEDFTPSDIAAIQDFSTLSTLAFLQKQIHKTRQKAALKRKKQDDNAEEDDDEEEEEQEDF